MRDVNGSGLIRPWTRGRAAPLARLAPVLAMMVAFFLAPSLAGATADPIVALAPASGPPTTPVSVTGTGFESKERLRISFSGKLVARATANKKGSFSSSIDVPKSAKPGDHTINTKGDQGSEAKAVFTVQVDWAQLGFEPSHSANNPYERVLSPKTLPHLRQRWAFSLPVASQSSPAVVDGIVYVGDTGDDFYAIRASDGSQLWHITTPDDQEAHSAPAVADGIVYINDASDIEAVDASSGTTIWSVRVDAPRGPTVAGGLVYFGSFLGGIYAMDAKTGHKRWSAATGPVASSVSVVDGVAYVGADDGNLHAFDAGTGESKWSFHTGDKVRSTPSVVGGVAYFGSDDGNIYAVDAASGQAIWAFDTGHDAMDAGPAVSGGVVYTGSEGAVLALRASDGHLLWSNPTPINIVVSPAVANGVVYIGTYLYGPTRADGAGAMAAYRASDGALLWSMTLKDVVFSSSPAVADGVLYLGAPDARIYAFGL
jgi:outer membrane protein assembly factor BamB